MKPEPKERENKDRRAPANDFDRDAPSRREPDSEFQRIARENLERYRAAMKELAK